MSERDGKTYRPWHPEYYHQAAYSPAAKLPEGDRVFFLLDTIPQWDLSRFYAPYEEETRGAPPYDPARMLCLLMYAYCVGVFASRKIALACERNLAFIAIVGDERPDFRTISDFRKAHLDAFRDLCIQVLRLAKDAGLVQLGNVSTDGTKLPGNASRHKAMSYGYMKKEVERLREEVESLVMQAHEQDEAGAVQAIPATLDNGYYSEEAVQELEKLGVDPYMATGRQKHHEPESEGVETPRSAKERMAAKVRTALGRALYARRKVIVEPVFGQIKEDRGFRRFLRRGWKKIRGEWCLVCLTHHLLKLWRYGCAARVV